MLTSLFKAGSYQSMRSFASAATNSSKMIVVTNLPKYWAQSDIASRFNVVGQVERI